MTSTSAADHLDDADQRDVGHRCTEQRPAPAGARISAGPPFEIPAAAQEQERQQPAEAAEPRPDSSDPPVGEGTLALKNEGDERHRAKDEEDQSDDRAGDLRADGGHRQ